MPLPAPTHNPRGDHMADDIAALEQELDAKYLQILDAVAAGLRLGKFDALSSADQERVESEAEKLTEQWMEESESAPRPPKTPLEQLIAEYAAIDAKMPEGEDDEHEEDERPGKK
jgi:hypothetical protein